MNKVKFETLQKYTDSQYEDLLIKNINEGMNFQSIKSAVSKIKNPGKSIKNLIGKFNSNQNKRVKKVIVLALIMLMNLPSAQPKFNMRDNYPKMDQISNKLSSMDHISPQDLKLAYMKNPRINMVLKVNNYKTSDYAKALIKKHESLKLTAYKLGDKMITIGYGHAESINKTKLIPGISKISKEQADKIFEKDLKDKEDGVKRMLLSWFRKEGINPDITPSMFDAMVSMSYNMGNYGLASSSFIANLKKIDMNNIEDLIKTAEEIKTTRINPKFKRGLSKRRSDEFTLFLKDTIQA